MTALPWTNRRRLPLTRVLLVGSSALVGLWLVAPILIVIPLSFTGQQSFQFPPPSWSTRMYSNFFSNPDWYNSLVTSLEIAAIVAVLATVLGTPAAFGVVRGRFPGKGLLNALLLAPMIVPIVVVAIGIYSLFLTWHLTGTTVGFVVAHTAIAVPFVIVTVSAKLRTYDRKLDAAAASLGAGPVSTFRKVTLPLIAPGILAGALFAFITSFDEVVIAIFLVDPSKRTLPVQMFSTVSRETDPTLAVASTLIIAFTTTLLLLSVLVRRKGSDGG